VLPFCESLASDICPVLPSPGVALLSTFAFNFLSRITWSHAFAQVFGSIPGS
jgi:hypothetical protein